MRHAITVRFLLPLTFFSMLSATALADAQLDRCQDDNPKVSIQACTEIIESGVETGEFLGTLYGLRGLAYYKDHQYALAVPDISKTIRVTKPIDERVDLFRLRAQAYFGLTDYPHAIADYTEAIRIKPSDIKSYNDRGYMFLRTKQYSAAITDYTAVLKKSPGVAQALYGRGLARRAGGDAAGANIDIAQAKKINGDIAASFADVEAGIKQ
jgi:tetratricopeptide (TPR) repeat protein